MEDLNGPDIHQYISEKLNGNQGFLDLRQAEPQYAAELINITRVRASGVFLWVILVVAELQSGLTHGYKLQELNATLYSLPEDLEALFDKMLNFGGAAQFQKASRMSQLVQLRRSFEGLGEITLLDFAFADEDNYESLVRPETLIPEERQVGMADRMRRRLDEACHGLLQVERCSSPINARVDYLHRTVQDYLLRQHTWQKILSATPKDFNPSASWSRAYLLKLKAFGGSSGYNKYNLRMCFFFIKNAELTGHTACSDVLAAVDQTAMTQNFPTSMTGAVTARIRDPNAFFHSDLVLQATANQLTSYTENKLRGCRVTSKFLKTMWQHALCHDSNQMTEHYARQDMVKLLLRSGAKVEWREGGAEVVGSRMVYKRTYWEQKLVQPGHAIAIDELGRKYSGMSGKLLSMRNRWSERIVVARPQPWNANEQVDESPYQPSAI